jgi:hypothetical protein
MCFYHDYAWTASETADEVGTAKVPTPCDECREMIPVGGWVRHIWMQEEEVCRHNPQHDDYDGPETDSYDCPPGCTHDFGETYDYDRCQLCDRLIEAIHAHEIKEGCSEYESEPALTELCDAMAENGKAYLAEAEVMYPGITATLPECYRHDDEDQEEDEDE